MTVEVVGRAEGFFRLFSNRKICEYAISLNTSDSALLIISALPWTCIVFLLRRLVVQGNSVNTKSPAAFAAGLFFSDANAFASSPIVQAFIVEYPLLPIIVVETANVGASPFDCVRDFLPVLTNEKTHTFTPGSVSRITHFVPQWLHGGEHLLFAAVWYGDLDVNQHRLGARDVHGEQATLACLSPQSGRVSSFALP